MRGLHVFSIVALTAFVWLSNPVAAQNERDSQPEGMRKRDEEIQKKMDERFPGKNYDDMMLKSFPDERGFRSRLMLMWRLVDYLNINEKTADAFFPVYMAYLKEHDRLTNEQRTVIKRLIDGIDTDKVPLKTLRGDVERLNKIENELRKSRETFLKKSESILDERQHIKLIIFEERIKEDIFRRLRVIGGPEGNMPGSSPQIPNGRRR